MNRSGVPRYVRVDVLHGLVVGGWRPLPPAAEGRAQEGEEPRRGAEGARGRRETRPAAPGKNQYNRGNYSLWPFIASDAFFFCSVVKGISKSLYAT